MGRIRQMIRVDGQEFWTLFDSGARNTYVVPEVAGHLPTYNIKKPSTIRLGGETITPTVIAFLEGEIEGMPFNTEALVLDSIGTDDGGKPIEVLFGALAMQKWGIRLVPETESLDLTHYTREFVEF